MRQFTLIAGKRNHGAVIVWLALVLGLTFTIAAAVFDFGAAYAKRSELQLLSNSIALSSVKELVGSVGGWRAAKLRALDVARSTKLAGLKDLQSIEYLPFSETEARDAYESLQVGYPPISDIPPLSLSDQIIPPGDPDLIYNTMRLGNFSIQIERGVYWVDPESSDPIHPTYQFISLESQSREESKFMYLGLPVYVLANSVRVTITQEGLGAGGIISRFWSGKMEVSAIATVGSNIEFNASPFAIPACELLINTDLMTEEYGLMVRSSPYYRGKRIEFNGDYQRGRDIQFMEANWNAPARYDGVLRSLYYPRPPLVNVKLQDGEEETLSVVDTRASIIKGVLGIPGLGEPGAMKVSDFAEALAAYVAPEDNSDGTPILHVEPTAFFGGHFRPIEYTGLEPWTGANAILDNSRLRDAIIAWFEAERDYVIFNGNAAGSRFYFTSEYSSNIFPFLRSIRSDLCNGDIDRCPPGDFALSELSVLFLGHPALLLYPMGNLQVNQHDPSGWSDILQYSQPPAQATPEPSFVNPLCHDNSVSRDPVEAQVRRVPLMLVVPRNPNVQYCKFEDDLFGGNSSTKKISPIDGASEPIVVGTLMVDIFDFRLSKYEDGTIPDGDRYAVQNFFIASDDKSISNDCSDYVYYQTCGGVESTLDYFPRTSLDNTVMCDGAQAPADFPWGHPLSSIAVYSSKGTPDVYKNVQQVCLPGLKNPFECEDFANPSCYEVKTRQPQYGCGGFRGRVANLSYSLWTLHPEDKRLSFRIGKAPRVINPRLVPNL